MVQPPDFKSTSCPHVVCGLKKPVYGLEQAPCVWHSKITQFLHQISFLMSKSNNYLFIWSNSSGRIFSIIYVDDFVIGGENIVNINKIKMLLFRMFTIKDMNNLHLLLRNRGHLNRKRHHALLMSLHPESCLQVRHDKSQANFDSWSSKKQPIVALSSTEAEYQGAVVATCEAIWLKRLLKDLQVEMSDPTTIYCDNLSNIQLAKNPSSTPGLSTLRCTTILSASVSSLVKSNLRMF